MMEFITLVIPFLLYSTIFERNFWKWISIILFTCFLLAIILFMTRSTWVAVFAGSLIVLIGITLIKKYRIKRLKWLIIGITAIIIGSFFMLRNNNFNPEASALTKQLGKITKFNHGTVKDRLVLWEKTIDLSAEKPLMGHGLGSWKFEILRKGNAGLQSEDNLTFYQRPHNDYLWILAETGIIGLIIYLTIIAMVFTTALKILRRLNQPDHQFFLISMLFSLVSYLTISLFSFPLDRIAHPLMLFTIIAGILIFEKATYQTKRRFVSKPILSAIILLSMLVILMVFQRIDGEVHLKKAFIHRSQQNWDKVIQETSKINNLYYPIDPFSTPVDWYTGLAYFQQKDLKTAYQYFQKAHNLNPYHIYVLNDLATSSALLEKPDRAIKFYKQAISYAPNFNEAIYNLSTILFHTGKKDSAFHYFAQIRPDNVSDRHIKLLEAIVYPRMHQIASEINENEIKKAIHNMIGVHKWTSKIVHKSYQNDSLTFKQQLILDAIFILEKNNTFAATKSKTLKSKYNLP